MNAQTIIEAERPVTTIHGAQVRRDAALRDAQDRFYSAWIKLLADYEFEKRQIERDYREGKFS